MRIAMPHAATPLAPGDLNPEQRRLGLLKFEILAKGIRLTERGRDGVSLRKPPIRTRSGVSGGVDIVLPGEIHVNCPVTESYSQKSDLSLDWRGEEFQVVRAGEPIELVEVLPRPAYYDRDASDGTPLVEIGQLCSGDRICIGMTRHCYFWARERRCRFCSIGLNVPSEASQKTPENIAEAVSIAAMDSVLPARHVLIGGGTPPGDDMGARFAAEATRAIKARLGISVYVMIVPPRDDRYIDELREAGVDELGMNVEFFDPLVLKRLAPGKHDLIGGERYFRALEYAARVFGPTNTRSIVIVGIEDPEKTVEGCRQLSRLGVMPILSPFRPLDGTEMEKFEGFDATTYFEVYRRVQEDAIESGVVAGPTCIPCQNNTLALPFGSPYRLY
jgi:radical SAM protein (TIGR04043 family)